MHALPIAELNAFVVVAEEMNALGLTLALGAGNLPVCGPAVLQN